MAEKKTLARRVSDVRSLLERNKSQLALALPRHITPDRMLRVAMTAVQRTPKLLEADQVSLFAAIIQAAQLGLEPDGALGQAYLIPFENRRRGVIEVQFMPGYRGLLALVRRSGDLSTVEVRAVHAKDAFRFRYGLASVLEHDPFDPGEKAYDPSLYPDEASYLAAVDPGPLVAVYAIARLKDGGIQWEVMRRHEVNAIRARSRSANDGPWVTDFEPMSKKTVLKRLCKLLPMSVEAQQAIDLDDKAEVGLPQDLEVPPGVVSDDAPEAIAGGSRLDQLTASLTPAGPPDRATAEPAGGDTLPLVEADK